MKRTHVMHRLGGALLIGCVLVPAVGIAAEPRGAGRGESRDFGRGDRQDFRGAEARPHEYREQEFHDRRFLDNRYRHDQYYPSIGFRFGRLPAGYHSVLFGGASYFDADALWYAFDGLAYVVVAPPIGIAPSSQGFVVVPEPTGAVSTVPASGAHTPPVGEVTEEGPVNSAATASPPQARVQAEAPAGPSIAAAKVFVYPRDGQSAAQESRDRGECHDWAVTQTGVDPVMQPSGAASDRVADYGRALGACLDGRGYTVR